MDLREYRAPITLKNGTPAVLRAIRPGDREALREGFALLSQSTVYHRFFQPKAQLTDTELDYLTELDFQDHVALVATIQNLAGEFVIGVGRMVRLGAGEAGVRGREKPGPRDTAEVAFVVGDDFQGLGVATQLLSHLVTIARRLGIRTLAAEVLGDNKAMLAVFAHSGLPLTQRVVDGVLHVEMSLGDRPAT